MSWRTAARPTEGVSLERKYLKYLKDWKNKSQRKPLLVDGARQTGKTYLIENLFAPAEFKDANFHIFDFRIDKRLHSFFEQDIIPENIIERLSVYSGKRINPMVDLIFFDEIGECQKAVDSLKYFAQKMPDSYTVASGSNLGLLQSFPVGKVEEIQILPMTFEEFLKASGNEMLVESYYRYLREPAVDQAVSELLWRELLDYYYVGGMPEAVSAWFNSDASKLEKVEGVSRVHTDLIESYTRDFAKYSGKTDAMHIESVFRSIPQQLSQTRDGSVARFKFKGIISKKSRYADLASPIDWLCKTGLSSKSHVVTTEPRPPLKALVKENIFRLFFFDLGLLGRILEIDYAEQIAQNFIEKGFIAENFVQNELLASGHRSTYCWKENTSEVEFLLKKPDGSIVPVEVKSGRRTQAKSLRVYVEKYNPAYSIKLVGKSGGGFRNSIKTLPIYYASHLLEVEPSELALVSHLKEQV